MRLVFGILGFGLLIMAILIGGSLDAFVNMPSVAVVLGGTALLTLAYHSPENVLAAIRAGIAGEDFDADASAKHISVLSSIRLLAVGTGMVGTLIGLVSMLQNMDDPSAIGPAMAMALLTALYGVIIAELMVGPMINRIRSSSRQAPSAADSPEKSSVLAVIVVPVCLLALFILLLAFPAT